MLRCGWFRLRFCQPLSITPTAISPFVRREQASGCCVLQIKNNQLSQFAAPWDIQLVGHYLVVREAERKILVDIAFEAPSRIVVDRGRFLRNSVEILVRPDRIVIANDGTTFSGIRTRNWPAGIVIGPHEKPIPAIIALKEVPRYSHDKKLVEDWIKDEFENPVVT